MVFTRGMRLCTACVLIWHLSHGVSSFGVESSDSINRERLVGLLNRLGNHSLMIEDIRMASFLDTSMRVLSGGGDARRRAPASSGGGGGSGGGGSGGGGSSGGGGGGGSAPAPPPPPPPPRRRVNPHAACECPEYSDALVDGCLTRRSDLLESNLDSFTGNSNAADPLRIALRQQFVIFTNNFNAWSGQPPALYQRMYLGSNGGVSLMTAISNEVQVLKGLTAGLAHCIDYMWAQLFVSTELSTRSMNSISEAEAKSYASLSEFMSALQKQQESANYENAKKMVDMFSGYMTKNGTSITARTDAVYKALAALDTGVEQTEEGGSELSSALSGAADTLQDDLQEFLTYLQTQEGKLDSTLSASLQNQYLQPFVTNAGSQVSQFATTASEKEETFSSSSIQEVASQLMAIQSSGVSTIKDEARSGIANAVNEEKEFVAYSANTIKENAAAEINAAIANQTNSVTGLTSKYKQMEQKSNAGLDFLKSFIVSLNTTVTSRMAQSRAAQLKQSNEVKNYVGTSISSIASAANAQVSQITAQAGILPSAMTTQFGDHVSAMTNQISQSGDKFANENTKYAIKSKELTSGIGSAYTQFQNSLLTNSFAIQGQVRDGASDVLSRLMTGSLGMGGTAGLNQNQLKIIQQIAQGQGQNANSRMSVSANGILGSTANASALVEAVIGTLAEFILDSDLEAEEKVALFQTVLRELDSSQKQQSNAGMITDTQIRTTASQAGVTMARLIEVLIALLHDGGASVDGSILNAISATVAQNQLALGHGVQGDLHELQVGQGTFDRAAAIDEGIRQMKNYAANAARLRNQGGLAFNTGSSEYGLTLQQILDAAASLNLAEASSHTDMIQNLLQLINLVVSMRVMAQTEVGRVDIAQLSNVSTLAASTNTVGRKMFDALSTVYGPELPREAEHMKLWAGKSNSVFDKAHTVLSTKKFTSMADSEIKALGSQLAAMKLSADQSSSALVTRIRSLTQNLPSETASRIEDLLQVLYNSDTALYEDIGEAQLGVRNVQNVRQSRFGSSGMTATELLDSIASNIGINNMRLNGLVMHASTPMVVNYTAFTSVNDALSGGAGTAGNISSVVGGSMGVAESLAARLQALSANQSTNLGGMSERQRTIEQFKSIVGGSDVNKSIAANTRLQADTQEVLEDYRNNLIQQALLQQSSPSHIADQLSKSRTRIDKQLQAIASRIALDMNYNSNNISKASRSISKFITRDVNLLKYLSDYYEKVYDVGSRFENMLGLIHDDVATLLAGSLQRIYKTESSINSTLPWAVTRLVNVSDNLETLNNKFDDLNDLGYGKFKLVQKWLNGTMGSIGRIRSNIVNATARAGAARPTRAIKSLIGSIIDKIENTMAQNARNRTALVNALEMRRTRYTF
jgi:hypothetical protein